MPNDDFDEDDFENSPEFLEIKQKFVKNLPEELDIMRTSIEEQDYSRLGRAIHTLKGTSGAFGFHELFEQALSADTAMKQYTEGAPIPSEVTVLFDQIQQLLDEQTS